VVSDYDGESGKPALEAGAEYHKPISNRTQFSEEALVTAVLDSGDNGVHLTNTLTLTHEVSDRIDWENSWLLAHSDYESSADITSNTLSSTYRYYLSNALSYSVTAKLTDIEDGVDGNGNDETGKTLLMGLTYRLK
jgi:hypothetical protein